LNVVGGVGELYQGDLDFGRIVVERLKGCDLGPDVSVEDFHYGAVAVVQRLEELRPESLLLVAANEGGRVPGSVTRRLIEVPQRSPAEVQESVGDAVVGYVTLDLVLEVGAGLGALPRRTVAFELEPKSQKPSETMSSEAQAAVDEAIELIRAELRRLPLFGLADTLHERLDDERLEPAAALETIGDLLEEISSLERDARWGSAFSLRDRLRLEIAEGKTGEGMEHLDWVLWWALIEELDRLQPLESAAQL
jgi:hydrogenase maturation protease